MTSKLLIEEYPLQVLPSLAKIFGVEKAIILQQIHWLFVNPNNGRVIKGERWIWNTAEQWHADHFPFWKPDTIRKYIQGLEKTGVLISSQFEVGGWQRVKYYRIDYLRLEAIRIESDARPIRIGEISGIETAKNADSTTTQTTTQTTSEIGGGAKNAPAARAHSTRKLSAREEARKSLEAVFVEVTLLAAPARATEKERKDAAVRWWGPLDAMLDVAHGDLAKAEQSIRQVYERQVEDGFNVSAPASILKNVLSDLAAQANGKSNGNGRHKAGQSLEADFAAIERVVEQGDAPLDAMAAFGGGYGKY